MIDLAATIVADLRDYCRDLLEAGLAPTARATHRGAAGGSATFSLLLRQIDRFVATVPDLIAHLDAGEDHGDVEIEVRRTPARARLPRQPSAWQRTATRSLLPTHWERLAARLTPDAKPLGYVRFVHERLQRSFVAQRERLLRHIEDARLARQGMSAFARQDLEQLDELDALLDLASRRLARTGRELDQATAGRVPATDRLPRPFPRAPVWTAFRRLADRILNPGSDLPGMAEALLGDEPRMADVPFLYQRWVGTRIVLALRVAFGFQVVNDSIGPLFLGGRVVFRRRATTIELWCEPRLGSAPHPSGLASDGIELTPDFVFVTPGHGGPDAFVLDATLSTDPTMLERKARYRDNLTFAKFRTKAGVPGRHRPIRAWAAAPILDATYNQLSRPDGSAGVVPMQPGRFRDEPLRAWLAELIDHADAWQMLHAAREAEAAAAATAAVPQG